MKVKRYENNEVVLGIDNWNESTVRFIEEELKLSPTEDYSGNSITYDITDSDTFSRVYSRASKSTEFSYIDNESYYDNMTFSLVYEIPGGKATLKADLDTNEFKLIVERS